ncbi:MAG TPA: SDR family oxidoreductase [Candidatus Agrococcus pullicola]|uniref:SDR family oxidoreductase n=1 Tax=Candidatus Agrococcus pullicola TaxID=2838429 RepID=A0A9D1YSB8_9MICO|nr:SDR family oxidoreductase [Candidatus Agrococcus pullicola]
MAMQQKRAVVVTGGAAGIGAAVARRFADGGCNVYVLDVNAPAEEISGVYYILTDLANADDVARALEVVEASSEHVDVLVNNAGVSFVGTVEDGTEEDWQRVWNINVMGYVRTTRAVLPLLRKSSVPTIVNVTSCTAQSGFKKRALYSATKGALESMTRAIAADLVEEGVTVNAVSPGTVNTPFMADLAARSAEPEAVTRAFHERQPTGRMVEPDEVALAVEFLAHPHNRSATGTVLTIDGGMDGLHITDA